MTVKRDFYDNIVDQRFVKVLSNTSRSLRSTLFEKETNNMNTF